jgi:hypothetical protein
VTHIQGADGLQIKFDRLLVGVSDAEVAKVLSGIGGDIKSRDMPEGFRQDLGGDRAMTNWPRRGDAMELRTDYKVQATQLTIRPQGRSYGPLSMLENGRTPRRAGQFRARGGRTTKDGTQSTRLALVTRGVGPMAAKNTWSDGADIVERRMPSRLKSWLNAVVKQSRFGR